MHALRLISDATVMQRAIRQPHLIWGSHMSWYISHPTDKQQAASQEILSAYNCVLREWNYGLGRRPLKVFRLDVPQASQLQSVEELNDYVWRYPVDGGCFEIGYWSDADARSVKPVASSEENENRVYATVNAGAAFAQSRRKTLGLQMLEVSGLGLKFVWVWHPNESWFLPVEGSCFESFPISAEGFTADLVNLASAALGQSPYKGGPFIQPNGKSWHPWHVWDEIDSRRAT